MKSLAELQAIRDKMRQQIDLRDSGDDRIRVVVGMATCGIAAGDPRAPTRLSPRFLRQESGAAGGMTRKQI